MTSYILPHLRRKGDPRIGQRGDFNPTAAFNHYDEQAAQAAQDLRDLIERTCGDQADQVKARVNQLLDAAEIPDADETSPLSEAIASLSAVRDFYRGVAAQIEAGTFEVPVPRSTLYDLARAAVADPDNLWCRGARVTLWTNQRLTAYVHFSPSVGDLYLGMRNTNGAQVEVRCARRDMFAQERPTSASGYTWTLTRDEYERWTADARKLPVTITHADRIARMVEEQRKRDEALPVQYSRGRSKLFKC